MPAPTKGHLQFKSYDSCRTGWFEVIDLIFSWKCAKKFNYFLLRPADCLGEEGDAIIKLNQERMFGKHKNQFHYSSKEEQKKIYDEYFSKEKNKPYKYANSTKL